MEASKNSEIYYSRGPTAETNVISEPSACQQIACGPRATGFLGCREAFFDDFGFLAAGISSSLWCPRLAPVLRTLTWVSLRSTIGTGKPPCDFTGEND